MIGFFGINMEMISIVLFWKCFLTSYRPEISWWFLIQILFHCCDMLSTSQFIIWPHGGHWVSGKDGKNMINSRIETELHLSLHIESSSAKDLPSSVRKAMPQISNALVKIYYFNQLDTIKIYTSQSGKCKCTGITAPCWPSWLRTVVLVLPEDTSLWHHNIIKSKYQFIGWFQRNKPTIFFLYSEWERISIKL